MKSHLKWQRPNRDDTLDSIRIARSALTSTDWISMVFFIPAYAIRFFDGLMPVPRGCLPSSLILRTFCRAFAPLIEHLRQHLFVHLNDLESTNCSRLELTTSLCAVQLGPHTSLFMSFNHRYIQHSGPWTITHHIAQHNHVLRKRNSPYLQHLQYSGRQALWQT